LVGKLLRLGNSAAMSASDFHDGQDSSSLSDIEKGDMSKEKDESTPVLPMQQPSPDVSIAKEEKDAPGQPLPSSITDWDGPDDPDNPHNWPMWLRVYHATAPGLFGFAV
jgi:hypothetical protein